MFFLHHGERLGFVVLGVLAVVLGVLQAMLPVEIVWGAFATGHVIYGTLMAFGLYFRLFGRLPRLSLTLIALGFYPIYASLLALITYLQFPLDRPLIDPLLMRLDAALGYDWVAGVTWLAEYPQMSRAMATVYLAALPQLALLLLWLGLTGRVAQLHRMLLTGMLAGIVTVGFWAAFPSFGPSAFAVLDPEIAARAGAVVTNDYGAYLMRLAEIGLSRIEKHQILGTIAFPSFHIVMAALGLWFARGTWLWWPCLAMGVIMVPATALHGGHHLVDLAGGIAVFALSLWVVGRLLPGDQVTTSGAARPVRAASPVRASTAATTGASAA